MGAGVGYSLQMNLSLRTHFAILCFAASLLCGAVEARPSPKNPPFTDAEAAPLRERFEGLGAVTLEEYKLLNAPGDGGAQQTAAH